MVELLHDLIFGIDYPGLSYALDPVTIALLTTMGVKAISKGVAKRKTRKKAELLAEMGLDESALQRDTAKKELEETKYSMSPVMRQMLDAAKQDPVADAERMAQQRRESQMLEMAKFGRNPGASATDLADKLAQQTAGIEGRSFARQQQARQTVGSAEQSVMDKNIAGQRELSGVFLGQGLAGVQAAQAALNKSKIQQAGAGFDMLGDVAGGVGDAIAANPDAFFAEEGTKVQETPGPFSHKVNPIDIMRDGAKIGEMTGGETILNPEQTGKIETLSSKGNSDLHKYVRKLFTKFDKEQ